MKAEDARFVWLFVFFDLPVGTTAERRHATRFRNFLKDDGYLMLQWSVYAKICRGEDGAGKHVDRVRKNLPPKGSVRALQVTDRQYARMKRCWASRRKANAWRPISSSCCDFRLGKKTEITTARGPYHRPSLPRGNR